MLPSRYLVLAACVLLTLALALGTWRYGAFWAPGLLVFGTLSLVGLVDITQTRSAVRRNYPIMAHLRFLLESIRPEIRQYFLEDDYEEIPYSRVQRSIVYQRAKNTLDKRPFGTQLNVYAPGYEWINHSISPTHIDSHDFRVSIGGDKCTRPYSASVFNISAMSFGSLSAHAILALNAGAKKGHFFHDTGEGSISRYHRENGGDLCWEIGSGYFGCRNDDGTFNAERFTANAANDQVKMIEIKLSQGAKPGHGGILPGAKVTREIALARGVPEGIDCNSPAKHSAFATPVGLLEFVQKLRELSDGKPVGFKLAIGHPWEWFAIAKAMNKTGILPDFIVVDGGEGGTGASPLEFTNHVGAPLREALLLVHNTLVGLNLRGKIRVGAAGKVVTAFDIARIVALGADWCNAARGFMFALGCIQSQTCHTDKCPTGVATQDPSRQRALVVPDKAERVYRFHVNTMKALKEMLAAAGLTHPDQLGPEHVIRRVSSNEVRSLAALHHWVAPGELLGGEPDHPVFKIFWPQANPDSFDAPPSLLALRTSKQR
jgi:glutamate synthase domain-containing protein 2